MFIKLDRSGEKTQYFSSIDTWSESGNLRVVESPRKPVTAREDFLTIGEIEGLGPMS